MRQFRANFPLLGRAKATGLNLIARTPLGTIVPAIKGNSLHSNAMFLMLAQGVMTAFGYVFWIIIARFYSSHNVGIASTLISVATLISQISILGLNNALVRFLPGSNQKNAKINTCLWLVTLGSSIIALIYLAGLPFFSPKLMFLRHDPLFLILFLVSMVLVTINTFTDSVFLANRATKYNVIIYAGYSIIRLIMPFFLIGAGALGIFEAHISGVILAVILSLYYMWRKFGWRPQLVISRSVLKLIGGYSLANYVAGFLWGFPLLIAPLLVVNKLGTSAAAYYYMVMMIVNVLQIIPTSTTQSLFAEGSHKPLEELPSLMRHSMFFTLKVTAVAVVLALIGGRFAIAIFGKEYATNGTTLLYIFAISTILAAINMTCNVAIKVRKQLWPLIGVNAFGAAATLVSFEFFLHLGLIGIGIGYMVGQAVLASLYAGIFGADFIKQKMRRPMKSPQIRP